MRSNRRILFSLFVAAALLISGSLPALAQTDRQTRTDQRTQAGQRGSAVRSEATGTVPAGLTFIPFVLFSTRYDDNIFSSTTAPESDTILSLTPGFDLTYLSPRTGFDFDYNITADKYARHSELTSWDESQGGSLGVNHWFTSRFNAGIQGSYRVTHNPGQLSPTTGLVLSRNRATQAMIQPEFIYDFTALTSMDVFYQRIRENLAGFGITKTGLASGTVSHELSPRDKLQFRYQNFYYGFPNGGSENSNLLMVGWNHALSRTANVFLGAGPRDTEGRVVPEILASIGYHQPGGNTYSLAYHRTQTVVIGQREVIDVQGLTTSFTFVPERSWRITFAPSYFHDSGPSISADVYQLGFYVWYRFAHDWSVGLTDEYRLQHGVFNAAGNATGNPTLRRNVIGISLRFGLPIRGGNVLQGEEPLPLRGIENRRMPRPVSPGRSRAR